MKEDYCYKKKWQEHYGKYPHGEKSEGYDVSPEEFANSMMENFKTSGILDLMKKKEVSMLVSSVGTGKRDWELLRQLDGYLGKLKKFQRPCVTLTDYALTDVPTEKEKKSIIKKPEQGYENLDIQVVVCDSYDLPFKENEFQVLYERLGALWHAAHEDIARSGEGALVQKMLEEYKRVVKPGGKIIFDCADRIVSPPSTVKLVRMTINRDVRSFFEKIGFEVDVVGRDEKFVILTNSDSKSKKK